MSGGYLPTYSGVCLQIIQYIISPGYLPDNGVYYVQDTPESILDIIPLRVFSAHIGIYYVGVF